MLCVKLYCDDVCYKIKNTFFPLQGPMGPMGPRGPVGERVRTI